MDPSLRDLVDELTPIEAGAVSFAGSGMGLDDAVGIPIIAIRIRDPEGGSSGRR